MKKGLSIFFITILIFSNISTIQVYAQSNIQTNTNIYTDPRFSSSLSLGDPRLRTGFELGGDSIVLGPTQERNLGEDIIINIEQNVPDRIRASLLEKQDVYVRSLLLGYPSNPSITVPRIRDVRIRIANVTTVPEGKKVSVSSRYINPRLLAGFSTTQVRSDPTYDNLGFIQTTIRRIPKEEDVPETIKISLDAVISFDVSEGLGFGPREDVLIEQTEQEWLGEKDQHSFFGGFIRASEVKADSASFVLYDNNMNLLNSRAITIQRGRTSGVILNGGYSRFGNLFNRFRIRVNDIRSVGEKAKFLIYQNSKNEFSVSVVSKGSSLYSGSNWIVEDIRVKDNQTKEVLLRNKQTRDSKLLSLQQIICEDLTVNNCVNFDVCTLSGSRCVQRTDCTRLTQDRCEINPQCSFNQQSNICETRKTQPSAQTQTCNGVGGTCINDFICPSDSKLFKSSNTGCDIFTSEMIGEDFNEVSQICCIPLTSQQGQFLQQKQNIDEITIRYSSFSKESEEYLMSTNQIIDDLQSVIFNQQSEINTRAQATSFLKSILSDLNTLRKKYQSEGNQKLQSTDDTINRLINLLNEEQSLQSQSTTTTPQEAKDYYKLAVQEYEDIVRNYPNLKDENGEFYSVKALKKIAKLYYSRLDDESGAIQAYESLLRNPNTPENEKQIIQSEIDLLKGLLGNFGTSPITIKDNEEEIKIKLIDIPTIQKSFEPKATVEINNVRKVVGVGDLLIDNSQDPFIWRVKSIGEESRILSSRDIIVIERIETNNVGNKRTITNTITSSISSLPIGNNQQTAKVRLINTDLKREVHVTIVPDSENAISESSFTLDIPIEKRAIGLPLFSDSLDEEINKTRKLVEKVDKLIVNMEKIHKFWINFCYITFGTLWSKNLIQNAFLSNQGIARDKIRDKWVEDYNQARSNTNNPYRGSFDQFVLSKREQYEQELEQAGNIVDRIQAGEYNSVIPPDLSKASEDQKKDWFFSQEMAKVDRDRYTDTKVQSEIQTRLDHIGKELDEVNKQNFDQAKNYLESTCGFKGITQTDYQNNKAGYLDTCRKISITNSMSKYFTGTESRALPQSLSTDYINKACGSGCPQPTIDAIKRRYDSLFGLQRREYGVFDTVVEGDNKKLVAGVGDIKQLYTDNSCRTSLSATTSINTNQSYYVQNQDNQQCAPVRFGVKPAFKHNQKFSVITPSGLNADRAKGLVEFISIDSLLYAQVAYTSGRAVKSVTVFERTIPNAPLGTGQLIGSLDDLKKNCGLKDTTQRKYSDSCSNMNKIERDISSCNTQLSKKLLDVGGKCSNYARENPQPTEVGQSCIDFMTPSDCALLFNACDPVLCPSSRCNLGGNWNVKDVTQTGIVGSLALCAPNFGDPTQGGVAVPICITGLLGGLQNIKSILQGYGECLNVQKVKGESVGVCDRVRNVYICDVLWREGIAIMNVKGGILGILSDKLFDTGTGGGEYANFKNSVDNSINGLKFFTQDYAKNVFATYSGGSLDEIGTEICKTAVFGKMPGPGFFDQITRPVSPPQYTAFFDSIPYSDVGRQESQYSVFHHIYAGANEDIRFSIYLRAVNERGESYLPIQYIITPGNRRLQNILLPKGGFSEQNNEFIGLSGYNQLCIEIDSRTKPKSVECGFGKVTTDFGINYLNEAFTANQALKKITTAEQCVPEAGRLTPLNYQNGISISDVVSSSPGAVVGSASTGILQTGIVRKCSGFNPGVGTNEQAWVAVGVCGNDERGRDLGTCWLYQPGVSKLLRSTESRSLVEQGLKEVQQKVAEDGARGLNVLSNEQINERFNNIQILKNDPNELNLRNAINLYKEIITNALDEKIRAKAQFELADTYEKLADTKKNIIELQQSKIKAITETTKCPSLYVIFDENEGEYTNTNLICPSTCTNEGCYCGLINGYVAPGNSCIDENNPILKPEQTGLNEEIILQKIINPNEIIATSLSDNEDELRYYKFVEGKWVSVTSEEAIAKIEQQTKTRQIPSTIIPTSKSDDYEIGIECSDFECKGQSSKNNCENNQCGVKCIWNNDKCEESTSEKAISTSSKSEITKQTQLQCNQCGGSYFDNNICNRYQCADLNDDKSRCYYGVSRRPGKLFINYFSLCSSCNNIESCEDYNNILDNEDKRLACIGEDIENNLDSCGLSRCGWDDIKKDCITIDFDRMPQRELIKYISACNAGIANCNPDTGEIRIELVGLIKNDKLESLESKWLSIFYKQKPIIIESKNLNLNYKTEYNYDLYKRCYLPTGNIPSIISQTSCLTLNNGDIIKQK